jgi:hypothetical protein
VIATAIVLCQNRHSGCGHGGVSKARTLRTTGHQPVSNQEAEMLKC